MTQQRTHRPQRDADIGVDDMPAKAPVDHVDPAETEAVLAEVDAVLEEIERENFKAKLKAWAARQPRLGGRTQAPPCVDCPPHVHLPGGGIAFPLFGRKR